MKGFAWRLLFLLLSTGSYTVCAQTLTPDPKKALEDYARNAPARYEDSVSKLVRYLLIPAASDLEKAWVLCSWVATHIKYDDAAYNNHKPVDCSVANVLKKKKSVCEGYSNVVAALCSEAGLKVEKISGYSKGFGYKPGKKFRKPDHAWNAIFIDGSWKLFDVTWASSSGTNVKGKLKSKSRFDNYWFDVDHKEFIFAHLPEDQKWQLLETPLSLRDFEKLPFISETFFKLGFESSTIYADAVSGTTKKFAKTFSVSCPVQVVKLPPEYKVSRSETLEIVLRSDCTEEIVFMDGKKWIPFSKDGTTFTLSQKPQHKTVLIAQRSNKKGQSYEIIVVYKAGK